MPSELSLYPLRFVPILKTALWGGENLQKLYGRPGAPGKKVAESWDLVSLGENVSVVANGPLSGRTLRELLQQNAAAILGKGAAQKNASEFPLLIKLLDAQDQLSLQVHPDDAFAKKEEGGKRGKNEMWYILKALPEASLICGFKPGANAVRFDQALKTNQFDDVLQNYSTAAGDVFFIPAGAIHAVGKGNVLFEIQVPSELTYRIYDWGRVEAGGKPRPTHREKALKVLKFNNPSAGKIPPKKMEEEKGFKKEALVSCPDFSIEKWTLSAPKVDSLAEQKCAVYCVVSGSGLLRYGEKLKQEEPFHLADTFLIPTSLGPVQIAPQGGNPVIFLRALPQ